MIIFVGLDTACCITCVVEQKCVWNARVDAYDNICIKLHVFPGIPAWDIFSNFSCVPKPSWATLRDGKGILGDLKTAHWVKGLPHTDAFFMRRVALLHDASRRDFDNNVLRDIFCML